MDHEGGPTWTLVTGEHNKAVGEPYQHWNTSGIADGLLMGGILPAAVYYVPVNSSGAAGSRYWTYVNVPKPDDDPMQGGLDQSREQGTWARFQQVECSGPDKAPPCKLHGWAMYWDSMAYAHYPGANATDTAHQTLITGPVAASTAGGFYANLLAVRRQWQRELAEEGMMSLALPSPASTNGSYLRDQAGAEPTASWAFLCFVFTCAFPCGWTVQNVFIQ
eukprot:SAG22_NODE_440_length_10484_cov_19.751661_5_plen_220_part_00